MSASTCLIDGLAVEVENLVAWLLILVPILEEDEVPDKQKEG